MTAVMERTRVVLGGPPVLRPVIETEAGRAEWEAASTAAQEPEQCEWCQQAKHLVRWRITPHPGDTPAPGVLDELVGACHCCTWGPAGLYERARREATDDRDIQVEHLERGGRWVRWETRF
ncbi:hypothetical protein [Amycolatopsis sp. Poz14]|uniref:hypothetical protein n=1 Tax=Amycolatopsis sp. Poz14 TaxID=1447705 RepID=UPI001EE788C1|nr:hypothetical protein [Amycolatopsis sp. Poz14]MCG3757393.1 hypothetical protein [Amycolatopsis sp. Poz14]